MQTYRKTHLFDLCLPKMTYKESDTYAPGDRLATFDTRACCAGVRAGADNSVRPVRARHVRFVTELSNARCYDLRFAEIATLAARQGASSSRPFLT